MTIEYFYINPFVKYNNYFEELGCKKGNKNELLRIIKANPLYCRNQKAINYDYFLESISRDVVIYITYDERVSYNNYIVAAAVYKDKRYRAHILFRLHLQISIKYISTSSEEYYAQH